MKRLFALLPLLLAPQTLCAAVDYETQIKPIFDAHCTKCHGEKRELGGFAMHAAALEDLIDQEYYIVKKDAQESEVYKRVVLPAEDDQFMPKGGKPLPAEEIELIKTWINEGASLAHVEGAAPAAPKEEAAALPTPEPATQEALKAIEDSGASVVALYADSPLLCVGFPSSKDQVTDETIDRLLAAAPNVVWLDLGGTAVTDAGAAKLTACQNLMRLHLENTKLTDASVDALAQLPRLEYLNLYGTAVTDAALESLKGLPKLQRLYLWRTGVTYEAAKKLMAERPELEVNLGWDHPGVVRDRLNKEIERVSSRKQDAEAQVKKLEAQLNEVKQQFEAANSREAELKKELEALDKPAE
ncbi:MAG: hypothetical protein KDA37_00705 [Planctomycetales bacterium]|nr:hypothetical protein [Planctomycetales bacterium]